MAVRRWGGAKAREGRSRALGCEVSENDAVLSAKLYAQAVTLVGYLIESYGSAKFTLFCRQLRDGKTVDESLSFAYADSIPDIGVLEKKWLSYYGGS